MPLQVQIVKETVIIFKVIAVAVIMFSVIITVILTVVGTAGVILPNRSGLLICLIMS